MAHLRIRKFNTKETYPEQKLDNDLSQAVVAKGTNVFLRGQVSQDLETRETLYVGDPKLQTRKTMENIDLLLILAFNPIPVLIACLIQCSLITGSIPGNAASTKLT